MHDFKLPSSLTISNCDEWLNKAIEEKSRNEKINLDSSEVETIDTAGVQFIYSFCSDKTQVEHISMSEHVKQAMSKLGLLAYE